MSFIIRQVPPSTQPAESEVLAALHTVLPPSLVAEVCAAEAPPTARRRKLPRTLTLLLVIAMNLFTQDPLAHVLFQVVKGLRLLCPDADADRLLATRSAICQARTRLGARPVVRLFHRLCRPLTTAQTPGAFRYGLRLVALDGSTETVPDTPANVRAFGRHRTDRGEAAFPQVQGVYLVECGSHAFLDAGFWPCHTSEHLGARRLTRSLTPDMLVLYDRGLHSFALAQTLHRKQVHFLGRVSSSLALHPEQVLPDGSYLTRLFDANDRRRRPEDGVLVRVIAYTIEDPRRDPSGQVHRLVTSLLDWEQAPALDLVCLYHERWEIEMAFDEAACHQRPLANHPLRSQTPVGVIQELYGLLLAHYAVRAVMQDAADQAGWDPDRLSFAESVRLVRAAVSDFQLVKPAQRPALYARLLADMRRTPLPPRSNRINPRVVKRKMSNFGLKREAHRHPPQPTAPFAAVIAVCAPRLAQQPTLVRAG